MAKYMKDPSDESRMKKTTPKETGPGLVTMKVGKYMPPNQQQSLAAEKKHQHATTPNGPTATKCKSRSQVTKEMSRPDQMQGPPWPKDSTGVAKGPGYDDAKGYVCAQKHPNPGYTKP